MRCAAARFRSALNLSRMPKESRARVDWRARVCALKRLAPVLLLIAGVIASIYLGIASPTDAAAVGVFQALLLSWVSGTLTGASFREGLIGATKTSCMIAFILAGAAFPSVAMGFTGVPRRLAEGVAALELSPTMWRWRRSRRRSVSTCSSCRA